MFFIEVGGAKGEAVAVAVDASHLLEDADAEEAEQEESERWSRMERHAMAPSWKVAVSVRWMDANRETTGWPFH